MDYFTGNANINPSRITTVTNYPGLYSINGVPGTLTPPQVATAYNIPANTGSNVKVGIISLGGGWSATDFNASMGNLGLPITSANITTVLVDGATGYFTGTVGDEENTLDLYCVGSMVPNANIVIYIGNISGGYSGLGVNWYTSASSATILNAVNGFANVINRAVSENCDVITISYVYPEILSSSGINYYCGDFVGNALANAVAKGITVCVSSGDYGSEPQSWAGNITAGYPATSANVVAVGGSNLIVTTGNIRSSETVEYHDPIFGNSVGSGGGISSFIAVPTWQSGLTANLYFSGNSTQIKSSLTGRGIPDLVAPMNNYLLWFNGNATVVGGTSASAPVLAGMFARFISLNGGRRPLIGNNTHAINSILYSNANAYCDITSGNNADALSVGYAATSGWDAVTGLGAPWGNVLYPMITSGGTKIKSTDGNWHYVANVKVKTATNTWSNVRAIWTKTINGWNQTY
jgi:kumamolisin